MAEYEPTTDGDIVGAKIGTSASGVAVGKDIVQNTVNVGRDTLDDAKTDINFIKHDLQELRFLMFTVTTRLDMLEKREPTQEIGEHVVKIIAWVFGFIVIVTFVLLIYAATRGLAVGH